MSQHPIPRPGQNVFEPIISSIPSSIRSRSDHPVPQTGVKHNNLPVQTNKFYANFFLGHQAGYTWTHPYSIAWSQGSGNARSWGLAVSHYDDNQKVFGEHSTRIPGSPARYFFSPVGVQSVILSAVELGASTILTTDSLTAFSINVNLQPTTSSASKIVFPVVQGMGFITGYYTNLTPAIQSSVFFRSITPKGSPKSGVFKYQIALEDNKIWLLYAIPDNGQDPGFQQISNTLFQGRPGFHGLVQVAKNWDQPAGDPLFDVACGNYPIQAQVTGAVSGNEGTYSLEWAKGGRGDAKLVMFALPHHVASFDNSTQAAVQSFKLATTTKGMATAVVADNWTMLEPNLPIDMDFAPYDMARGSISTLAPATITAMRNIAIAEAREYQATPSDVLNSLLTDDTMYFGGKKAHRLARIVYTIHDLLNDTTTAAPILKILKDAVNLFAANTQRQPLAYDSIFKGIVSSSGFPPGAPLADFGNTFYNDHHFHWAYWLHTAALLAHMDPAWGQANKDWVNALAKDACNPVDDAEFPFSRNFDWYHGHSWAHGLFEFGDGKDLESTSEDAQFAYAIKMWGKLSGDRSMEARGNLMLKILSRTLPSYFLYTSDNTIMPAAFIGNKVSGILFENKCDHATFFDGNLFAIQGIHMIPLLPCSPLIRSKRFVQEEWDAFFRAGGAEPVDAIQNNWRGVIMANLALLNPAASWDFFLRGVANTWNPDWLDNGQSRTWSLAMAAGLGGGPA